ncbi:hypothetical protein SeMB42_g05113 [Synchytrium endobioticum]|uniref:Protein kinase domain-containing protein n=1 Tax=Synchytrium endobioticum TaxID=286115 RepID=A0A507CTF8_9FUNG|nr:hypothetical protein SeMB42_g05113 [Synchytrium endobioticum]TPX49810.1 hypothetical protein SeLEV6574_g01276 [Synchytrium endobioticum]
MPSSFDPASLVGKITPDGSLQLIEIIGSGSFSVVCRAVHVQSGLEYAVKCLFKFNLNPQQLAIQRQEATILSQLPPHPNVIQLEKVMESPTILFLVFPYLPSDLFEVILDASSNKGDGLADETIRDMMLQICSAVKHCHDHGVFHRDIKPENILAEKEPSGRHVLKLADFGLATIQAYSGDLGVGSLRYQSPQALRTTSSTRPFPDASSLSGLVSSSSKIGNNSSRLMNNKDVCMSPSPLGYWSKLNDVWALGVVFINLITGRNPWAMASASDPTYAAFTDYDKNILAREFRLSDDTAAILRGVFEVDEDSRSSLNEFVDSVKLAGKFRLNPIIDKAPRIDDGVPDLTFSSYTPPHYMSSSLTSPTRLNQSGHERSNPKGIAVPKSSSPRSHNALKTPKAGIVAARSYQKSWCSDLEEMDWENGIPNFDDSGVAVSLKGDTDTSSDDSVVHDDQDSCHSNQATPRTSEDDLLFDFEQVESSISHVKISTPPTKHNGLAPHGIPYPNSNASSRPGAGACLNQSAVPSTSRLSAFSLKLSMNTKYYNNTSHSAISGTNNINERKGLLEASSSTSKENRRNLGTV